MDVHNVNLKRIFISHASKDRLYGDAIVRLLRGIGLRQSQITFTGNSKYGIPPGKNIFDYLRNQISDDTYMICLLSSNYYNSIVCLNEMGAAWVQQVDTQMLLLPGFDTSDPRFHNGVANPNNMAARVDDGVRIRAIIDCIINLFGLDTSVEEKESAMRDYFQEIGELQQKPAAQLAIGLAETERNLRLNPQDSFQYLLKGYYLYDIDNQDYPKSVQSLLYAMYLNPNDPAAYYRLIQVVGKHGDHPRSLAVAEETMRRFPEEAYTYGCHAYALVNLRCYNEAINDLTEAIQRGPNQWFYYLRATSYQAVGDIENALTDLWTVYDQYDPSYENTVELITGICKKMGQQICLQRQTL